MDVTNFLIAEGVKDFSSSYDTNGTNPSTKTPEKNSKQTCFMVLLLQAKNSFYTIQTTCRLSKNFLPCPCKNKSKEILKLSRSQMRRLIELITGQNNLNYVQSKVFPGQVRELCRFCEEENETFAHLINECPCFITMRRDLLKNIPIINTLIWKAKTLLKFSYVEGIDEALAFDRGF